MDFLSLLKSRHSIKSFKDEIVPRDKIKAMLDLVTLSPSYKNLQSFKLILITDNKIKAKIENIIPDDNSAKKGFVEAPISIVVTSRTDVCEYYEDNEFYMLDGAVAMFNLLLAATNEGLGSCWIEIIAEDALRGILNIPSNYRVIGLTPIGFTQNPIGYIKPESDIIDKKNISDMSYENLWNKQIDYF
ncbi:MAG: nitroreductase family protein [Clostridium sp.]